MKVCGRREDMMCGGEGNCKLTLKVFQPYWHSFNLAVCLWVENNDL